jgi:diamine N-acetyltransferase
MTGVPLPAPLQLRRAHPDDAVELAELMVRTFRDTYSATSNADSLERHVAEHFGTERQAAELADPAVDTLVVDGGGGGLVAFAQLRCGGDVPGAVRARRPLEVMRFYVDRPWHGRGVAARLMDACVAAGAGRGADALWLLVYRVNGRALAFYRRQGFAAVGTHPFHFGGEVHDDVVMARALTP